jgi:hypothetical protein
MENSTKIMLGVTGVAILGVGVWLITRKPSGDDTTTTTTTTDGGLDPSAQPVDTLGSTIGNLITNIWGKVEQNKEKNKNKPNCTAPIDGYSADGVDKSDYNSSEIVSMQTWLSNYSPDVKAIIDKTGGTDGIIGSGFKTSYNMVRTACGFTGIDELETKSGIA